MTNAFLNRANLAYANVTNANMQNTQLITANLIGADLRNTDLRGASIDFSCFPLWCGSKDIMIDEEQAKQLFMHIFNIGEKFFPGGLIQEQKDWLNTCRHIQNEAFPKF